MFSKVVRRTHMYLALFLAPWMLMYALSTIVMNHRAYFLEKYGRGPVPFQKERELTYPGTFPEGAGPRDISRQILASLEMEGAHGVNRSTPSGNRIVIEKMEPRTNAFLERFHRRRGYTTGYGLDTVWAVSVDLVIVAMVFWALSGLWMWWEMKATRFFGLLAALGGAALFALYLMTI
jgi:hypothetical protein